MPRTKPQRQCGSCAYWNKWHDGRGLCEKLDCAGKADAGRGCRHWKGKKYHRHNAIHKPLGGEGEITMYDRVKVAQEERAKKTEQAKAESDLMKLLCCPFCGDFPYVYNGLEHHGEGTYITCLKCQIEIFSGKTYDAYKHWNTRAT